MSDDPNDEKPAAPEGAKAAPRKEQKLTEFEKGTILFRQGQKGGELFFIKEGEVELIVRDQETMTEKVVAQVGENSVLGTMTFLEGEERSATAKCLTDVKAIVVNQIQREKLLAQVPIWFKVLLKDLSGNLRHLNEEYVRLAAKHEVLEKRVAIMKTKLKESDGESAGKDGAPSTGADPHQPDSASTKAKSTETAAAVANVSVDLDDKES